MKSPTNKGREANKVYHNKYICRLIWAKVAQRGLISSVLFSLYVNDLPSLGLAQYAEGTALVATSRQPELLENYLDNLEIWLRNWRITINVGKNAAVLFTTRHIPSPRQLRYLREEMHWAEKFKYLGSPWIGDLPGPVTYTR